MYILGINPGHNGTAALLKDGKVVGCVSEERFSRLKNHVGFPFNSVQYLLKLAKITAKDLDYIILSTKVSDITKPGKVYDTFQINYSTKGIFKKTFGYLTYKFPNLTEPLIKISHALRKLRYKRFAKNNAEGISKIFGIDEKKVICIDHHLAHALSVGFNLPENEKSLVFTNDGEGDGLCATVNIFDGKTKELKRIAETPKSASLGYLYGVVTLYLGMKPNQHEFKVMGLAPYAKKDHIVETYNLFKDILWVDGLKFKSKFRMQYADSFMIEKMKYKRFDNISGGIQKLAEDLTYKWINNAINRTGISSVGLAGGVFMNVKANQKISEMPGIKKLFCMPSAGDESTALGACFYGYKLFCDKSNIKCEPKPIEDLYLGPEYDDSYIEKLIEKKELHKRYVIKKIKNINQEVAKLLAKGEIVARCSGRSEWGARALGNRSILSNAINPDTIRILNETIKDRDFWMPFTPSMIDEDFKRYALNPKKFEAPYMILTFNSTGIAKKHIPAAMHPYDFTIRPQVVYKSWNPDYYEIIKQFKVLTGVGGLLNTSFNLHGEPNVLTPEDALHTVENSDLKYLAMGHYMFEKKK